MEIEEIDFSNSLTISTIEAYDFPSHANEIEPNPLDGPLKEDLWGFGFFWWEVDQKFPTIESLYAAIQDLYDDIEEIKETYRLSAEIFDSTHLEPNTRRGISGSYFLLDDEGRPTYIVKPLDEDAGCIHNNGYASPFIMSPLRSNMPLYLSSMREVLAYQIATSLGVGSVVPKTVFGLLESEQFHSFSNGIDFRERDRFLEICGPADREKLCSVQEFVPNAKSLFEGLQDLQMAGLSDDEIAARFDQADFEDANILLWTTYDTDGHMGNFLVYPKGIDEIGNEILGLKKVDNGLAFPDENKQLRNNLSYLPNARRELSPEAKAKIARMDIETLSRQFEQMGLDSAIPALRERIPYLQQLAQEPGITIKEINKSMSNIGKKP
jgi:hypothetical protein